MRWEAGKEKRFDAFLVHFLWNSFRVVDVAMGREQVRPVRGPSLSSRMFGCCNPSWASRRAPYKSRGRVAAAHRGKPKRRLRFIRPGERELISLGYRVAVNSRCWEQNSLIFPAACS